MSRPPSNHPNRTVDDSFAREARFGLTVVAMLVGVFLVVAWGKYNGWFRRQPMALQATHVNGESTEHLVPFSPFIAVDTDKPGPTPDGPTTGAEDDVSGDVDLRQVNAGATPREVDVAGFQPPQTTVIPSQLAPPRIAPEATFGELPAETTYGEAVGSPATPQRDIVYQSTPDPYAVPGSPVDQSRPPVLDPVALTSASESADSDATETRLAMPRATTIPNTTPDTIAQRDTGFVPRERRQSDAEEGDHHPELPPQRFASLSPELPSHIGAIPNTLRASQDDVPPSDTQSELAEDDSRGLNQAAFAEPTTDLPETPAQKATSIVAQEGDSFWLIAQRVYDDGRYFNALYQANRHQIPSFDDIDAGTRIATPDLVELRRRWPDLCPGAEHATVVTVAHSPNRGYYTTAAGDTLFDIAREELGQASRYVELIEINRSQLPEGTGHDDVLPAGLQVRLPLGD